MDWHAVVGVAAGLIQLYSIVPYIKGMIHGEVRPNIVSWALWAIIQFVVIGAQIATGISWAILIPAALAFNTILVLILCFRGYGYTRYGWLDAVCFMLVVLAIVLWQTTNNALFALALSIIADFLAGVPTYLKVYKLPYSESTSAWVLLVVANILALVSISTWTWGNSSYSLYGVLISVIFIPVMIMRRRIVRPRTS